MDYQQKYLKYKSKYNQLKENQNNQIGGIDFGELRAYFLTEQDFKMCIENQVVRQENNKIMGDIERHIRLYEKIEKKYKGDDCKLVQNIKKEVNEKENKKFTEIENKYINDALHGGFYQNFKDWLTERKLAKKAKKDFKITEEEHINKTKSKEIIKKITKLHENINNNINQKLYNGEHKRCNFNIYGMNLYDTAKTIKTKLEKFDFNLERHVFYCKQNSKFIYYYDKIHKQYKKELINEEISAFDYTNKDNVKKYKEKIDKKSKTETNYMIIVRHYKTNPDILISVYNISNDEYKLLLPKQIITQHIEQ